MESEVLLGILLRTLPAIAVFALAFVAAIDKNTRERWGNLLYQVGSIRPDQREDPKIGRGVKWPFFIVALGLLIWPIQYFRHASVVIDASSSDLKPQSASDLKKTEDATKPQGTPTPVPTPGPAVHAMEGAPNTATAPSTPSSSQPGTGDLKQANSAPPPQGSTPATGDLKPLPR